MSKSTLIAVAAGALLGALAVVVAIIVFASTGPVLAPDEEYSLQIQRNSWDPLTSNFMIGTVVPIIGPSDDVPAGWLKCDGRTLQKSDYEILYQILKSTSGSEFSLPNYSGMKTSIDLNPQEGFSFTRIYCVSARDSTLFPGASQEPLKWFIRATE